MNLLQEIWIEACTQQLRTDCPRLELADADHIAQALWREGGDRRRQHPMLAARNWLAEVGFSTGTPARHESLDGLAQAA